jgi:aspartate kinase
MLEMSASGAGVLQLRSVEYARNHGVQIHCRSSFSSESGTIVVGEADGTVDRPAITAVTHSTDEARVTLEHVPNAPGMAGRIATVLADANVNIDMIIQNEPVVAGAGADMSFTVPRADLRDALAALGDLAAGLGIDITTDESVGKVSVIGEGMKTQSGVAAQVFSTLGSEQINIQMIATSPIKISCVIELDSVQQAVRALHAAFLT